jgi:hypothetical protein
MARRLPLIQRDRDGTNAIPPAIHRMPESPIPPIIDRHTIEEKKHTKLQVIDPEKHKPASIKDVDFSKFKFKVFGTGPKKLKYLPRYVRNTLILGKTNSGKSTAIDNILLNWKVGEDPHVYLFVPSLAYDNDTHFLAILDKRKIPYSIHGLDEIDAVVSQCKSSEGHKLLIFDDFGNNLRDNKNLTAFMKENRKVNAEIILSSQYYVQNSPEQISQCSNFLLFKMEMKQLEAVKQKIASFISADMFDELYYKIIEKPYNFMTIDTDNNAIFEKFDKLIYTPN